jgi:hypothetical protein
MMLLRRKPLITTRLYFISRNHQKSHKKNTIRQFWQRVTGIAILSIASTQ